MKKLFCFVAIALLVVGLAVPAFAAANATAYAGSGGMGTLQSVTTINTDYGTYDETNISVTSYVIPGKCEIAGWDCNVLGTQSEGMFSVVDASSSTAGDKDTLIIAENEATNTIPVNKVLPKGIGIVNGLTIRQGPRTSVTVYYIQVRP